MSKTGGVQGFQYVVERKVADPICFGSKIPRCTDPIGKCLSPFQKREQNEIYPKIGPGHYNMDKYKSALDAIMSKVHSTKGVGPLASNQPRFPDKIYMRTPSPTRYAAESIWKPAKPSRVPFGSRIPRKTFKDNDLPGPGTYKVDLKKCRRTRFMYNFGCPKMIQMIEIICVPIPTDTCIKCNEICKGDYWQQEYTTYLCHLCWEEERRLHEMLTQPELENFKINLVQEVTVKWKWAVHCPEFYITIVVTHMLTKNQIQDLMINLLLLIMTEKTENPELLVRPPPRRDFGRRPTLTNEQS